MTLEGDDGYEEDASSALTPGVDGVESPLQEDTDEVEQGEPSGQPAAESNWQKWYLRLAPLLGYLPTGKHEEDTERDGILSYSVEVHAAVIGLSIGMAAATTHDIEIAMTLVAVALGVGRMQQQFSETVRWQLKQEPAYALGGFAVGYLAVYLSQTGQLPPI